MTALDRYAKLEAVARYFDGPSSAPREVVVSFGERSLVIMGLDDEPIAHWPLASLRALGPAGARPVEIVPDAASAERLLLDDFEMSDAIAEVCPDLHRLPPPRPRRRFPGWVVRIGALAAVVVAAIVFLRPLLPASLADMVAPEREAALGEAVATRLPALLDPQAPPPLCIAEEGVSALRALSERLAAGAGPDRPLQVSVMDHPGTDAIAVPGGRVLVLRGLLQAARSPEELAGVLAHAIGHARGRDPLNAALRTVGPAALAAVLLGDITGERVVAGAADSLDAGQPPEAEARADEAAFDLLAQAGLPSLPYAALADRLAGAQAGYAARHPWSPARRRAAEAADTVGAAPFTPALRDRDWIALGNTCDRTRPMVPVAE